MKLQHLVSHQWKRSLRTGIWQKNLIINLFLGLSILYFLVMFLLLGLFLPDILETQEIVEDTNPVTFLNGLLLYYFLLDLLTRLFVQDVPVLMIQPYLHLPIRKSRIVHYLLSKVLISAYNLTPFVLLLPFAVQMLSGLEGTAWFISLLAIELFLGYLVFYIKKQFTGKPIVAFSLLGGLALLGLLEYLEAISLYHASVEAWGALLSSPWLVVVPLAMLAGMYYIDYRFLMAHTYPEELAVKAKKRAISTNFGFLSRYGKVGDLIALEMRLIWRHKRTRSVFWMSCLFLLYGLLLFPVAQSDNSMIMYILGGLFVTGMFMLNYGQFLLSWHAGFFDSMISQNISAHHYLKSKLILLIVTSLIATILSLPYAFFGWEVLLVILSMAMFNIGVSSFIILFFATLDPKKIDLAKSSAMNWQGVGAAQFLLMIPIMVLPILIQLPLSLYGYPWIGVATIGCVGIISLLMGPLWLRIISNRLLHKKYEIANNFRQD